MTKAKRHIAKTRAGATGTDAACFLAATVIRDAFRRAVTWNDAEAEEWLRESQRIRIFCAGLGVDHTELLSQLDRQKRRKTKKRRGE